MCFALNNTTDCAVCGDGYVASLGFSCERCSKNTKSVVVASIFAGVSAVVVVGAIRYLMSAEIQGEGKGVVDRMTRRVPVQAMKIVIVAWQILTQVTQVQAHFPSSTLQLRIYTCWRNTRRVIYI